MNTLRISAAIRAFRREQRMSQTVFGEYFGVTAQAVSKWERELSCPDIGSIPKLAEILGVSVEELMQSKKTADAPAGKVAEMLELAPKAVAAAMGIAVAVLALLDALDVKSGMVMLGIGLACVGISLLSEKK